MLFKTLLTLVPGLLALSTGAHAYASYDADPSLDLYSLVARDLILGGYLEDDAVPLYARAALPGRHGGGGGSRGKSGGKSYKKSRRPTRGGSSTNGQQGSGMGSGGGTDDTATSGGGSQTGSNQGSSTGSN